MTIINTQDGNPVTPTNPLPVTLYAADGSVLLGTPVAAGDGLANPTAARILSFPHLFDGTTWQRQHLVEAMNGSSGTGIPGVALVARQAAGVSYYRITSPEPSGASLGAEKVLAVAPMLRVGNDDFQPEVANQVETVLPSAARAASTSTAERVNHSRQGVTALLRVTASPGGGETLQLGVDITPDGASWYALFYSATFAFGGGSGALLFQIGPGAVSAPAHAESARAQLALPRRFRFSVIHSAAGSWTYSLVAMLH